MMIDRELLDSFVVESRDLLDEVEPSLIEMQQTSDISGSLDRDLLDRIFRLFHSMKGSAGFLGLDVVSSITHEAETLLDMVRKEQISLTQSHTVMLCDVIDFMRELLELIETEGTDSGKESFAERLVSMLQGAITGTDANIASVDENIAREVQQCNLDEPSDFIVPISKEMIEHFTHEADDLLELVESSLLACGDTNADVSEPLREAFRGIHSLKGNSGIMGLADLQRLAHRMEETLTCMIDGQVEANEGNLSVLLNVIDVLRGAVADAENDGQHIIHGCDAIIELLGEILPDDVIDSSIPSGFSVDNIRNVLVVDDEEDVIELVRDSFAEQWNIVSATTGKSALELFKNSDCEFDLVITDMSMPEMDGATLIKHIRDSAPNMPVLVMTAYGDKQMLMDLIDLGVDEYLAKPFPIAALLEKASLAIEKAKRHDSAKVDDEKDDAAEASVVSRKVIARNDIRVDISKLDTLINLVGELVIAEAMVTRNPIVLDLEDETYERAVHQLRRVTMDLQDIAMGVRMVPLSATFRKMIRLVHDVSGKAGKQVNLELRGEDTEVDKTVIEKIADPLVHIVRNSIDHGIESPSDRIEKGKKDVGTLVIEGRHEGGEVWIIISDDGKGLDRDKILAKGIERGLVSGNGEELSDSQVHKLIFEPGFSTADQITDISGRGVGMDVVKRNIEGLNGRIDVHSCKGEGTTVVLRIPLTLAIIDGMLVRVGTSQYTIPILSIRETLKPTIKSITRTPDGREVVRVRDEMIPVLRLHEVFGKEPQHKDLCDGILIIIESDDNIFAIFVDEIVGQQETVIKGLSSYIGKARGTSGCTILGNGEVSLILDVNSLVDMVDN
jgi:two-component system chemotaxis sensor kinase CheA